MARKTSRKETTTKRHTNLPPKVESPKVSAAAPVTQSAAVKAPAVAEAAKATVAAAASVAKEAEVKCTAHPAAITEKTEAACEGHTAAIADAQVKLTAHAAVAAPVADGDTAEDNVCCKSKVHSLLAALGDTDADVARDAATELGLLGDESAVQPLIDVLSDANGYYHTVVRAAAAASLGQLGDVRAVKPLLDAISDPMAEVSAEVIAALETLGDRRAVDALIDVVRNATGYFLPTARRAAVLALARLGGEEAAAELRHVAGDTSEDSAIREAAEEVTQQFASQEA
jgi:hypothetical protein